MIVHFVSIFIAILQAHYPDIVGSLEVVSHKGLGAGRLGDAHKCRFDWYFPFLYSIFGAHPFGHVKPQ